MTLLLPPLFELDGVVDNDGEDDTVGTAAAATPMGNTSAPEALTPKISNDGDNNGGDEVRARHKMRQEDVDDVALVVVVRRCPRRFVIIFGLGWIGIIMIRVLSLICRSIL